MEETLLVGTDDGLHVLGGNPRHELAGRSVRALASEGASLWAIAEEARILRRTEDGWDEAVALPEGRAVCLLSTPAGLLVGTSGAHLYRLAGTTWERVDSFESVAGRADWYTPWGGPPDTRSLSYDGAGNIYVNVHVGGIAKSSDAARTWQPTIAIHADVHQVLALASPAELVLAASARGLGVSEDGGKTWRFITQGLVNTYLRALAAAERTLFVAASDGPSGRRAGVYRRALASDSPFERCRAGLPEWFSANIDTNCLNAGDRTVAFGTAEGEVFVSRDQGATWELLAKDLAPVRCVLVQ